MYVRTRTEEACRNTPYTCLVLPVSDTNACVFPFPVPQTPFWRDFHCGSDAAYLMRLPTLPCQAVAGPLCHCVLSRLRH